MTYDLGPLALIPKYPVSPPPSHYLPAMTLPPILSCWAVSAPGAEMLTAAELEALGVVPGAREPGGVAFEASAEQLADALVGPAGPARAPRHADGGGGALQRLIEVPDDPDVPESLDAARELGGVVVERVAAGVDHDQLSHAEV